MNRYTTRTATLEGGMILLAVLFMIPVYVLVNLALRPLSDLSSPLLPTLAPTLEHFTNAWRLSGLGQAMVNSVVVVVVSVSLIVAFGSLAAYGLTRITSGWSTLVFYLFMIGLVVPFQLGLVPLYRAFASFGMIGSFVPLIIIYVGLRLPFTIFLYSAFLREIPKEYEEAASIDGASQLQRFRLVVFPLLRPVTGTLMILNGLFVWNDFMNPLLYLSGTAQRTVPLAVYSFVNENHTAWPLVFAGLIISVIPVLITYFSFQESLIKGFASGVKG